METQTTPKQPSFLERNSALIKGFFIAFLVLILLIPTALIQALINERENRKNEAIKEVSSKWANQQTLNGPILRIPYYEIIKVEKVATGKKEIEQTKQLQYAYILPNQLEINGQINPEKRSRGIYDVVVYGSKMNFKGEFSDISLAQFNIANENIVWKDAAILLTINDFRGIEEEVKLKWNGKESLFNSGAELTFGENNASQSGIFTPVEIIDEGKGKYQFDFALNLKGSESLNFVPVGKTTQVKLNSKWQNPSFNGAFLPDDRLINSNGFSASWKVLHLNRNFPQQWLDTTPNTLFDSSFGVKLFTPNDSYQQSSRSVKYAILIIALTFMAFFFVEIINSKKVHPFNYLLIGLALCIFYTLLISISEFISFNQAYFIAAIMTLGLVFLYAKSIFQNTRLAGLVSLVMLILYGFIFVIIQLEDTALLIGSIGLFLILAITMYVSRKIDWSNVGVKKG